MSNEQSQEAQKPIEQKPRIVFQEESKPLPPDLQALKFTKAFYVEYHSEETGETYRGTFVVQRLTTGALAQYHVMRSKLNGGLPPESLSRIAQVLNDSIAYMTLAVIEAPDWWKPEQCYEPEMVIEIASQVRQWESSFRRRSAG